MRTVQWSLPYQESERHQTDNIPIKVMKHARNDEEVFLVIIIIKLRVSKVFFE